MKGLYKKILLVFIAALPYSVLAGGINQSPKLIKGVLPNGVTYYIYPNDYPKGEAVYRLFLKTGSLYEKWSQRGLAHFLEHMAFNGTRNFPDDGIIKYLTGKGAKFGRDINAHTSMNETVYKLTLPTVDVSLMDTALIILSDWSDGLLLDSLQIEKERGVIMSEWLSRKGPEEEASDAFLSELLNGSRYSERKTIGDTAIIKNFKRKELVDYYDMWYHPTLTAVAVVGDIDPVAAEKVIKERFGSISSAVTPKIKNYKIKNYKKPKATVIVNDAFKEAELTFMELRDMPKPVKDEKSYKDYLFRSILNRLIKNRFNLLAYKDPSYSKGSASLTQVINAKGIWYGSVELFPTKITEGIEAYAGVMEQIYRYGFTKQEISYIKRSLSSDLKKKITAPSPINSISYMDEIYSDFYRGNIIVSPQEEYRLYNKYADAVDSVSIHRMVKSLCHYSKTHYMLTAFDSVKNKVPSSKEILSVFEKVSKSGVEPYVSDVVMPDRLIDSLPKNGYYISKDTIPEIGAKSLRLSNGAHIIFKRSQSSKGKIGIRGYRKGGLYALDSTDYVSGSFAASIVPLCGAGEFSRDDLSLYTADNSAIVKFLIANTRSGVSAIADSVDIKTMFELLYLKWTKPRIDTAIYNQIRKNKIEEYRTSNKTEEYKFSRDFSYLLREKDYVRREITDTVIINELKSDRLIPIFNQCFGSAKEYTFIVTGDCDYSYVEPYIMQYISTLPDYDSDTTYIYKSKSISHKPLSLIRFGGDSPKASVILAFQQDSLSTTYQDFELEGQIAKDLIRTRLLNRLREEMGMIYSVGVKAGITRTPDIFARETIQFACQPANVDTLIASTFLEIESMIANPDSFSKDLSDVKESLIKDNFVQKQKESYWSSVIRETLFDGISGWDYITDYDGKVNSVTPEDIAKYIKEAFIDTSMIKGILYPKNEAKKE